MLASVLAASALLTGISAQHTPGPDVPPGFDPHPSAPSGWTWRPLATIAATAPEGTAWERCARGDGGRWSVLLHPWLGTPSMIITSGIHLGQAPLDGRDATVERLRAFALRRADLLGIDRPDALKLHRVSVTPNPSGHRILGVDFKQTYRGYDVWTPTERVRVRIRADGTLGRVSVFGLDWIPRIACPIAPIPPGARDRQYQDPMCAGSYHCYGQAWVGFTLDLRDLMLAKHGPVQGKNVAETITIAQYDRAPASMPAGVLEVFVQDDNDANLTNGSPDFKQIARAADGHSFPRPADPPYVKVNHTGLADTRDTVNPYPVSATITAPAAPVNGAWVVYRVGSGGFTSLALNHVSGNTYAGAIPALSAVSHVAYRIVGRDGKNNVSRLPEIGDFTFTVGQRKRIFFDDFETDQGWTGVHTAWTGRFERADPIAFTLGVGPVNLAVQPEDDHTPGSGTHCYVTQNGDRNYNRLPDNYDVDHGYTEIRSPVFDVSSQAASAVRVRYARWFFTFNHDDALTTDVSADGGQTWKNAAIVPTIDNRWVVSEATLPGPYTNRMQVRFRTEDDPNDSLTDACIDDVEVVAFDDDVAALKGASRTPGIGAPLPSTFDAAKRPGGVYAFALSLAPGPTPIPGLGNLDLGLPFHVVASGVLDASGHAAFWMRGDGWPLAVKPVKLPFSLISDTRMMRVQDRHLAWFMDRAPNGRSLRLDFPGEGGRAYVVAFGMSGPRPGVRLADGRPVPINPDALTWASVSGGLGSILRGTVGVLDPVGRARVTVDTNSLGSRLKGLRVWAVALLLDRTSLSGVSHIVGPAVLNIKS
jgi:hypothetical protein